MSLQIELVDYMHTYREFLVYKAFSLFMNDLAA